MGLIASLGLSLGAVLVAERLDTTFHTADELRGFTDIPILASIRRVMTETAVRRQRGRAAVMVGAALVGVALVVAGSYYVTAGNERIVRLTAREAI